MTSQIPQNLPLTLGINEIQRLIPHRYPFLLIDRLEDIEPGLKATGIKNVSMNEPFFQGHFPGYPIMPGVLIVEAMAQTAAALVTKTMELEGRLKTPVEASDNLVYFMSIESAKYRKPVFPGDVLRLQVEKIRNRGPVWKFSGKAYVEGKLTDEAEFTAMIAEPKPRDMGGK